MKIDDKVKVFVKDAYVVATIKNVVPSKGFRKLYDYDRILVEFEDGTTKECREWDLIPVKSKEKENAEL